MKIFECFVNTSQPDKQRAGRQVSFLPANLKFGHAMIGHVGRGQDCQQEGRSPDSMVVVAGHVDPILKAYGSVKHPPGGIMQAEHGEWEFIGALHVAQSNRF